MRIRISHRYIGVAVLAIGGGLTGCATIVSGTDETVKIGSSPSGATVLVDAVERGQTPLEVELERGRTHRIEFKKAGFVDDQVMTTNTLNGWIFGNILAGGLIGIIVDLASGATNNISPNPVTKSLIAVPPPPSPPGSNAPPPVNTNPPPAWMRPE
jgi:hypothetical protein